MNESDIISLAGKRYRAREEELTCRRMVARQEADLALLKGRVLASAYADGSIDGKNADVRSRQEAEVLASSLLVQEQAARLHLLEDALDLETVDREYVDDLVSLTKAWLYSQAERS